MKSKSCIINTLFFLMISIIGYCQAPLNKIATVDEISDTTFVNLKDYSSDFIYDMRYATDNNFLKAQVYDCAECLIRYKTVKALIKANNAFIRKGFQIKLYDCYRPLDIQKRMWTIVPNPKYVADPSKGSIHNRGGAVDITLVNLDGEAVPMGTDFDFFGIEASHKYINLPTDVISNRKFLKKIMAASGFQSFDSEWWHYNLKSALKDPVSNAKWDCN
ncbi:M15 family metallopeptidase [Flavobacterium frigidarium]|uniref:M15 family metallopeptidase n=1 Tax=Flavobacterium frigidarium TaxID=99286 RepID=UPI00041D2115